jgi:hypothetical protein
MFQGIASAGNKGILLPQALLNQRQFPMAKPLPRTKLALFHVIMWGMIVPPFLAAAGLLWVSIIAYDIVQHPERHQSTLRVWNIVATNVYYLYEVSMWQSQSECVQYDAELLYKPSSGCHFSNKEYSTEVTFSEDGRLITSRSDAPARPIFFAGDSDTMGWGVNDDETFAALIASSVDVPVLNLGVSSYGTVREIQHIQRHPRFRDANCIVIQYSWNDFDENEVFLAKGALPPPTLERFQELLDHRPRKATFTDVMLQTVDLMLKNPVGFFADVLGWQDFPRDANPLVGSPRKETEDARVFLAILASFPDLNGKNIFVKGPDPFISALSMHENLPANVFPMKVSLNVSVRPIPPWRCTVVRGKFAQ